MSALGGDGMGHFKPLSLSHGPSQPLLGMGGGMGAPSGNSGWRRPAGHFTYWEGGVLGHRTLKERVAQ